LNEEQQKDSVLQVTELYAVHVMNSLRITLFAVFCWQSSIHT